ncbi:DMT family transporter [Pseudodesulfovibrio piezophilus]|uniref:DMT family transporter n=1 Tax=Pseudodesulfovibrio piezophilus (strain DSM 21447 / JCM 15486 / C1TLV30) TaxID=1322246 RepID=M1WK56_PSEP2|nr:DMT family transporter [Pseudodesulfovibrio piezophilus]CCH49016.1 conserved membrane protein of unknown function [Pseudodesulfovibrio piezophilus C1TLV30]
MKWIFIFLALLAGAALPLQAGINLRLRYALNDPVMAAFVSFAVGTVALGMFGFLTRPVPSLSMVGSAPLWSWTGGALGAFFVCITIVLAGKLGATTSMAWLLTGQFLAALVLDHFGLVSFDIHPISWPRLVGIGLLIAGAVLVNKY